MLLGEVIDGVPPGAAGVAIADLAFDDRLVGPGTLFFCVPGFTRDGHDFAPEALARGAAALVVERPLGLGAPEVVVPSVRAAMASAAARFHGDPTARLAVVGVTGTNGKTTTAFLVRSLLEAAGRRCGLLGTVKSVVAGEERTVARTTPEAIDLQRDFRAMVDGGDEACAMEVSSHALELRRADAIHFAVAIFTNLTQDHLDFHPTMEDYFQAKRRLFQMDVRTPIVNVDDAYGRRLAEELPGAVTIALDREATYRARDVQTEIAGARFTLDGPDGAVELRYPLPGRFNVQNVLCAVAAARALGVDMQDVAAALPGVERVPGRFEPVDEGQDFGVLVDYAHTPDSLSNSLRAARAAARGRVIAVIGCGGDRDRGKRPVMGAIAGRLADFTVVTSDNPRSEDPLAIIAEVTAGVASSAPARAFAAEADRRAAIGLALGMAEPGAVVLIAGKGHEQGQELAGGRKLPFDDRVVAREELEGLLGAGAGS
jgi:UDP-N-acetylmuramoyl-L-alanyl-D-glutamate--2,6-diaminopimelate ligase